MKKLITIYSIDSIEKLSPLVDGFIIGSNEFGTRLTNSFTIDEINTAIKKINYLNKEVFLNANQMFTDIQLDEFIKTIHKLDLDLIKGIIVADIGTFQKLANKNLNSKVIYNPETLLTNTFDFNYLANFDTFGAYVAKEITLKDILEIGNNKKYKLFYVGHGHLNMFYSKRHLLDNYSKHTSSDANFLNKHNLKITEQMRKVKSYPILEDDAGTHVFRSAVLSSINYMNELSSVVDYFVIDTIFKDDNYAYDIASLYSNKTIDNKLIDKIKKDYNETWDEGFLNKKTFYKR